MKYTKAETVEKLFKQGTPIEYEIIKNNEIQLKQNGQKIKNSTARYIKKKYNCLTIGTISKGIIKIKR